LTDLNLPFILQTLRDGTPQVQAMCSGYGQVEVMFVTWCNLTIKIYIHLSAFRESDSIVDI